MDKQILNENEWRITLEEMLEWVRGFYQNTKFNWGITVKISSTSAIRRLVCPSHDIKVDFLDDSRIDAFVELKNPGDDTFFNNDFVLLFRNEEINKPSILFYLKLKYFLKTIISSNNIILKI